jgi:16S rRNA (uracil1498-N3)-methyltransferase
MLERLTQLGAARVCPWTTSRSSPPPPAAGSSRHGRLLRVMGEACKQSGRLWLPELGETTEGIAGLAARTGRADGGLAAVLAPTATRGLGAWARTTIGGGADRVLLAIGPEGGLTPEELDELAAGGIESVRAGPHTLRIETAAEAAVAIVAEAATEP